MTLPSNSSSSNAPEQLIDAALATRDDELTCEEFVERVAAYAEILVVGGEVPAALSLVAHHASICPHCAEELKVLLEALSES